MNSRGFFLLILTIPILFLSSGLLSFAQESPPLQPPAEQSFREALHTLRQDLTELQRRELLPFSPHHSSASSLRESSAQHRPQFEEVHAVKTRLRHLQEVLQDEILPLPHLPLELRFDSTPSPEGVQEAHFVSGAQKSELLQNYFEAQTQLFILLLLRDPELDLSHWNSLLAIAFPKEALSPMNSLYLPVEFPVGGSTASLLDIKTQGKRLQIKLSENFLAGLRLSTLANQRAFGDTEADQEKRCLEVYQFALLNEFLSNLEVIHYLSEGSLALPDSSILNPPPSLPIDLPALQKERQLARLEPETRSQLIFQTLEWVESEKLPFFDENLQKQLAPYLEGAPPEDQAQIQPQVKEVAEVLFVEDTWNTSLLLSEMNPTELSESALRLYARAQTSAILIQITRLIEDDLLYLDQLDRIELIRVLETHQTHFVETRLLKSSQASALGESILRSARAQVYFSRKELLVQNLLQQALQFHKEREKDIDLFALLRALEPQIDALHIRHSVAEWIGEGVSAANEEEESSYLASKKRYFEILKRQLEFSSIAPSFGERLGADLSPEEFGEALEKLNFTPDLHAQNKEQAQWQKEVGEQRRKDLRDFFQIGLWMGFHKDSDGESKSPPTLQDILPEEGLRETYDQTIENRNRALFPILGHRLQRGIGAGKVLSHLLVSLHPEGVIQPTHLAPSYELIYQALAETYQSNLELIEATSASQTLNQIRPALGSSLFGGMVDTAFPNCARIRHKLLEETYGLGLGGRIIENWVNPILHKSLLAILGIHGSAAVLGFMERHLYRQGPGIARGVSRFVSKRLIAPVGFGPRVAYRIGLRPIMKGFWSAATVLILGKALYSGQQIASRWGDQKWVEKLEHSHPLQASFFSYGEVQGLRQKLVRDSLWFLGETLLDLALLYIPEGYQIYKTLSQKLAVQRLHKDYLLWQRLGLEAQSVQTLSAEKHLWRRRTIGRQLQWIRFNRPEQIQEARKAARSLLRRIQKGQTWRWTPKGHFILIESKKGAQ